MPERTYTIAELKRIAADFVAQATVPAAQAILARLTAAELVQAFLAFVQDHPDSGQK